VRLKNAQFAHHVPWRIDAATAGVLAIGWVVWR